MQDAHAVVIFVVNHEEQVIENLCNRLQASSPRVGLVVNREQLDCLSVLSRSSHILWHPAKQSMRPKKDPGQLADSVA